MQNLEIIMGCMFSGKSTELIKRIRCHRVLSRNVVCITHGIDQRYNELLDKRACQDDNCAKEREIERPKIITHNLDHISSISAFQLADISREKIEQADVICIEEAQFFNDLYENVLMYVNEFQKYVIVCGLDGDFQAQPFINVLRLIPHADHVVKLSALCMDCKDGTAATFTKRLQSNNHEQIVIGGSDLYKSVCRFHFNFNHSQ